MDAVAESRRGIPWVSTINQSDSARVWRMSRPTRDGTAEPVSRNRVLRRERGQGKNTFPVTCLKENLNASKSSEHPSSKGEKLSKRLGVIRNIGYKD